MVYAESGKGTDTCLISASEKRLRCLVAPVFSAVKQRLEQASVPALQEVAQPWRQVAPSWRVLLGSERALPASPMLPQLAELLRLLSTLEAVSAQAWLVVAAPWQAVEAILPDWLERERPDWPI